MNKLKAFTVLEIIIVLLISGIVIALSLNIYLNMEKLFYRILSDGNKYNEIMFFHNRLKNDFDKAKYVKIEIDELIIYKEDWDIIKYNLGSDYLTVSANNITDTLKLKIKNYNFEYLNEESRLISDFSLELKYNNNNFPFYFTKKYSNKVLFEYNNILMKN